MADALSQIESLLFISPKPLSVKKLGVLLEMKPEEVQDVLKALCTKWNESSGGIRVIQNGDEYQMATSPDHTKLVQDFIKDETMGELTRPALETLTIVAYRAPLTKAELEQIRGVNCTLILRNLMIRGLVESYEDADTKLIYYKPTFEFLRHLGLNATSELPDYTKLNSDENLELMLKGNTTKTESGPVEEQVII